MNSDCASSAMGAKPSQRTRMPDLCQALQRTCTVAERLLFHPHALEKRKVQVTNGCVFRSAQPSSGAQRTLSASGEKQRKILHCVKVPILQRAAEHDHGIIEQRCPAF